MSGNIICNIVVTVMLFYFSVEDICHKSIVIKELIIMGTISTGYMLWRGKFMQWDMMAAVGLLIVMVFMSRLTGCFGLGDIVILGILTEMKGGMFIMRVFVLAVSLLFISALGLVIVRKVNRKYTIPFVPYIFVSALGVMLCG